MGDAVIRIQPYDALHQQGVIDTILPIQQLEFRVPVTLADQPDLLDIPGFYQTGAGNFWVALADGCGTGEVVGTIALRDFGNGCGALRKMFVKGSYRGTGGTGGTGGSGACGMVSPGACSKSCCAGRASMACATSISAPQR